MNYNENQKKAIETVDGNVVVIASAGSGKTTVLTKRIENMVVNHNIDPQSILAITFSKKAKETIEKRLEKMEIYVSVETFHSFALKIINDFYKNKYKLWKVRWQKESVINDICKKYNICSIYDVPYNDVFSFISLQKHNMKKPTDDLIYPDNMPFKKTDMNRLYKSYEEYKDKNSFIEFDDFLNIANDIFAQNINVKKKYQDKFKYVLTDEFQDVSKSQAVFLKQLNTENTMIVGDPLQAIYSFRGGDSKYILNFDREYKDVTVIPLNTNYRCSKDIVKTANKLAQHIPDSKHRNYVESVASKENYKVPQVRSFMTDDEECKWISKKIKELNGEYKYKDISILARTNAQLQKFESTLYDNNIPYDIVNGNLFTDQPEIKLIVSYLRLSIDTDDNDAFTYLYNKPNRWLGKMFLQEVEENSKKKRKSLYDSMFTIDRRNWKFKNGIEEIFEVVNHIQNKHYSSVSDIIKYLRTRLDIDNFVTNGCESDDGSFSEKIENLNSFENICSNYKTIESLLSYLDELNREVNSNNGTNKIQLSTIHRAKGLEFPVVFIAGCNDALLPHCKNKNIDDERRLFYVGITRAERELYLSYFTFRNGEFQNPSPFLKDIEEIVDFVK